MKALSMYAEILQFFVESFEMNAMSSWPFEKSPLEEPAEERFV